MKKLLLNDIIILVLIILNSIVIFLLGFDLPYKSYLNIIDYTISTIFILEIYYKIKHYGTDFFTKNWNIFDFILVLISVPSLFTFLFNIEHIDLSYLLVFRTLRVFKVFRFFKFIKNIDKLLAGIRRALKASILILISFVLYIFIIGILSHSFFSGTEHFSDPLTSIYSVLKIFTLEGWYEIPDDLTIGLSKIKAFFIKLYFILILVSGGIFGLSLVNSIFVDSMISDNNDDLEKKVDDMKLTLDYIKRNLNK